MKTIIHQVNINFCYQNGDIFIDYYMVNLKTPPLHLSLAHLAHLAVLHRRGGTRHGRCRPISDPGGHRSRAQRAALHGMLGLHPHALARAAPQGQER